MEEFIIDNRRIVILGNPKATKCVLQLSNEHSESLLQREYEAVKNASSSIIIDDFALVSIQVKDWNNELSPWLAAPVFGTEGFGEGAQDTLDFLEHSFIPWLDAQYKIPSQRIYMLAGYSLAGLFALWSAYESSTFSCVAAVSPSVWFPGWIEFIQNREIKVKKVYLSLGNRESKTRNEVMAKVGENIELQYQKLKNQYDAHGNIDANGSINNSGNGCVNPHCILEWNEGNHFKDSELRLSKGIAWMLDICY